MSVAVSELADVPLPGGATVGATILGMLPTMAFAIVAQTGNIYSGLWYPVIVALMTLVIGGLLVRETRGRPLDD